MVVFILSVTLILTTISTAYSQEDADADTITLSTYYPSPYGIYDGLVAYRLGVGDTNNDANLNNADLPLNNGQVYLKGYVGINTTALTSPLTVNGIIESTSGGFKFPDGTIQTTAGGGIGGWTDDGSFVRLTTASDNVGIGTLTPSDKLHIAGSVNISANSSYKLGGATVFTGRTRPLGSTATTALFVGEGAGANNYSSFREYTHFGYQAGFSASSGNGHTLLGYQAGYSGGAFTINGGTTYIGESAGYFSTTAYPNVEDANTFIGYRAGYSTTSTSANAFLGYQAGYSITSGCCNTLIGYQAGYSNIADRNISIGYQAGYSTNTSGEGNTLIGSQAGYSGTGTQGNTFLGTQAGYSFNALLGSYNTFLGYQSGYLTTSSNVNTFLGYQSGYNNLTGSSNVFIGYQAGYNETGSNKLYIANSSIGPPLIYGDFSSLRVGINKTNPLGALDINGTAYCTSGLWSGSDVRWKENITPLTNTLDKLLRLRGVEFNYRYNDFKDKNFPTTRQLGIIAQDLEKEFPRLVFTDPDGYKSVAYDKFTAVLLEGIKEQTGQIYELSSELEELDKSNINQGLRFLTPEIAEADSITLTTYYPSPYGVYDGLMAYRLGVGDNSGPLGVPDGQINNLDAPTTLGQVYLKGYVGINTTTLSSPLTVNGIIESTSGGFKFPDGTIQTSAPIVVGGWTDDGGVVRLTTGSDNVGIGTLTPLDKLDVVGSINIDANNSYKIEPDPTTSFWLPLPFVLTTSSMLANTFVGYSVGANNTSGYNNTFLGVYAGSSNTTGNNNTFSGNSAGSLNTTGNNNTFSGMAAGTSNTTGNNNTFAGTSTGSSNTTGSFNAYLNVYQCCPTGICNNNTFLAGKGSGNGNISIGFGAHSGPGDWNTVIGISAGYNFGSGPSGSSNTFLGQLAGLSTTTGSGNTSLGEHAGSVLTTGNNNTALGNLSGVGASGGETGSIFLGASTGGGSNKLYIGNNNSLPPLIYGDFSLGRVGINTTTPQGTLGVGALDINGTAYCTSGLWSGSDVRWKENITPLTNTLDKLLRLRGVEFNYRYNEFKDKNFPKDRQLGIIAQNLEKEFPQLVFTDPDGYKSVAYDKFTAVLLEGIKEQQKEIEDIEKLCSLKEKANSAQSYSLRLSGLFDTSFAYAQQESITLTTYYPSPYGVYDGLMAYRLGVGDNSGPLGIPDGQINNLDAPTTLGQVYLKGYVGINTTALTSPLTVNGIIESTSGGFKFPDGTTQATAAGADSGGGWTDDGGVVRLTTSTDNVGIGALTPSEKLHITANVNIDVNNSYKLGGIPVLTVRSSPLFSTFLGENAGATNYAGWTRSTLAGYQAGFLGSGGDGNTFTGYQSGYFNAGSFNTFYGSRAGYSNTSGTQNTFYGYQAGYSNNLGINNTFYGSQAGFSNTIASSNTFLGYQAGYSNILGNNDTFIGSQAGYSNTTGVYNTFVGSQAGYSNIGGNQNTFIGYQAGYSFTSGFRNTFLGYQSAYLKTSGNNNTILGYQAGYNNLTGSSNVFIGYQAGYNEADSNTLYIANSNINPPLIYGDFLTGRVGINKTNPLGALDINGEAYCSSGLWTGSDIRWKENITPLTNTLDKLLRLRGVEFNYRYNDFKDKNFPTTKQLGIIAQDLEKEFPQLVFTDPDGYKSVAYDKFTAVLLEGIKEQQRKIDELRLRIRGLKARHK